MNSQPTITRPRWNHLIGPAVILLAAAVAVAPQLTHGPSCGHDFNFHLASWFDCLTSWRHGIPYPHWAGSANFGAGEPRFIFYPPLTWMLGATLGILLPWQLVPVALTFLFLAATGLATRALARHALSDAPATLAGCAALFSGYALFTAYERTAFGELSGGFWIPLLLLFILRDRNPTAPVFRRALDGSTTPLALILAGCWLSNVPLGIMACYLLAAIAVTVALINKSWAPILRSTLAAVTGIALAAIYLLPAIIEQRWIDLRQATDYPSERIENSWLFASHADPAMADHDTVLLKVSILSASMLAVALISLFIFWLRGKLLIRHEKNTLQQNCHPERSAAEPGSPSTGLRRWGGESKDLRLLSRWLPLALIPFAILFLQLPISLPVWNLLPKLRFLQFPWRWLVVLEAPMAIFFAVALWPARRWLRIAVATLCAAFFLAATAYTAHDFYQSCNDQDSVPGMMSVYHSGAGFVGTDEYTPPGADNALLPTGLPAACLVTDPTILLGKSTGEPDAAPLWNSTQASCDATPNWQLDQPQHKRLRAFAPYSGYLILRLRSYPAWRLAVNGRPVDDLPQRDDGLIALPVPQGEVDLAVDWTTTSDIILGRWLSVLAVLLLTTLYLMERKLQNSCRSRLS